MLIPRKVKFRKQHHPKRDGQATGGTKVSFGEYGIQALTPAYVTNRQIESARIAMTRHIKRGGKVWIYKGDLTNKELAREQANAPKSRRDDRGGDRRRAPRNEAPVAEGASA
jgi:ribosomal protein L16